MISAVRVANNGLLNASKRVDKAVQKITKATATKPGGPEVADVIEFKSAGHAFKASAKVSKMANEMQRAMLDILT